MDWYAKVAEDAIAPMDFGYNSISCFDPLSPSLVWSQPLTPLHLIAALWEGLSEMLPSQPQLQLSL